LHSLTPPWERWLPAGESLKKRQLAGKAPALPGGFEEDSEMFRRTLPGLLSPVNRGSLFGTN